MQQVLFTEGQHVKKGDLLARIDPRLYQAALDQAKAKKSQDTATLIGAEKDLVRSKTLVVRNVATEQTVDQQQARVDQLKASIEADQAAIETAQTQFDYTFIKAPSDGRIGVRLVDPGNLVHASDTRAIASLVLTQPSAVMFTLPMQVLDDLREAMARGPVEVQAYDQNDRRLLSTGKLLLIDNAIDQATATIRLKAMFANEDERLWPGEFVNARVLIDTRRDVIAVPTTAIQRGANGLFVWIVNADSVVESRPVMVGPASGDLTVIERVSTRANAWSPTASTSCRSMRGSMPGHRPRPRERRMIAHLVARVGGAQRRKPGRHRKYALAPQPPPGFRRGRRPRADGRAPPTRATPASQVGMDAMNISEPFIRRPVATSLHHGGAGTRSASWRFRSCPSRRCRRSISRPSRSPRRSPAPAPRPWRPRLLRRWSASSARSPASPSSPRSVRWG